MKTPDRATVTAYFYNQKIKDVKKKDILYIGSKQMKVLTNQKNTSGGRVLTCVPVMWKNTSVVTLILPKEFRITVQRRKTMTKEDLKD